jgi:hypothetical protein
VRPDRSPIRFHRAHRIRCPHPHCRKRLISGGRRPVAVVEPERAYGFGVCECGQNYIAFFLFDLAGILGLSVEQADEYRERHLTVSEVLSRAGWIDDEAA